MSWTAVDYQPPSRTLRQFAALCFVIFGSLGAWRYVTEGPNAAAIMLLILACALGPTGLVWPAAVRPIFVGWMLVAFPIRVIVAHVVLGTIFYCCVTPLALVFRCCGRDVLHLRRPPSGASCWLPKPSPEGVDRYLRQY